MEVLKIAGIIEKLKGIENPVTGVVICVITGILSAVVIVTVVALSFGTPPADIADALKTIITMGSSFLFSGFLIMAKGTAGSKDVQRFIPVTNKDMGSQDF